MYNLIHKTMQEYTSDVLTDYARVASILSRVFMDDKQLEAFSGDDQMGTYILLNAMSMGLKDAAQKVDEMQKEIRRLKDTYEPDALSQHRLKIQRQTEAA